MNRKHWASLFLAALLLLSTACAEGAVDVILSTGTTQAFSMEALPAQDVETILKAGLSTASAINQQPWHLVAVTNADVMEELGGSMAPPAGMPGAPAGGPMPAAGGAKAGLGDSPLAILVYKSVDTMSPNPDFDCGLACQNMVIAASALGYGAKIVSAPTMSLNGENHDAICQQLGIDTSLQAVAVVLVGKADADAVAGASTRNALEEEVTYVP